ncbi:hypothetical protein BGZ65_006502 [Modicella reniformis]|uniref:EH domain-containing protein n=1 Tax=Modicella reniformis TaxID=1440133 RepID=A0A9P6MLK6_9FUNG|nr:hypothetical protein BGZ65_006502 [Modicella reniformis]
MALRLIAHAQHGLEVSTEAICYSPVIPPKFTGVDFPESSSGSSAAKASPEPFSSTSYHPSSPQVFSFDADADIFEAHPPGHPSNTIFVGLTGPGSSNVINPPFTEEDKDQARSIFEKSKSANGRISGERVREFFITLKIHIEVLADIWDLADIHHHGSLDQIGFGIAFYYIMGIMRGTIKTLPRTLPPALLKTCKDAFCPKPRTPGLFSTPSSSTLPGFFSPLLTSTSAFEETTSASEETTSAFGETTSAFGTSSAFETSSVFETNSAFGTPLLPTSTSAFGPLPPLTSTSPFGTLLQPTYTSPFGTLPQPTFTSPFGTLPQPTFTSPFGTLLQPTSTSTFGTSPPTSASAFGIPSSTLSAPVPPPINTSSSLSSTEHYKAQVEEQRKLLALIQAQQEEQSKIHRIYLRELLNQQQKQAKLMEEIFEPFYRKTLTRFAQHPLGTAFDGPYPSDIKTIIDNGRQLSKMMEDYHSAITATESAKSLDFLDAFRGFSISGDKNSPGFNVNHSDTGVSILEEKSGLGPTGVATYPENAKELVEFDLGTFSSLPGQYSRAAELGSSAQQSHHNPYSQHQQQQQQQQQHQHQHQQQQQQQQQQHAQQQQFAQQYSNLAHGLANTDSFVQLEAAYTGYIPPPPPRAPQDRSSPTESSASSSPHLPQTKGTRAPQYREPDPPKRAPEFHFDV